MRAVAEGGVVGALAAAEIECAGGFGNETVGQNGCALVPLRVAEGLAGRAPAPAPEIGPAFLELDNVTLLPHVGSASQFTRDKMGQLVVDNLLAYKGRKPPLTPTPDTPFIGW